MRDDDTTHLSALTWLRDKINRYQYDYHPVQNVLELDFIPALLTKKDAVARVQSQLYEELKETLSNVTIDGVNLQFVSSEPPMLFYTRNVHSDVDQARALKQIFAQFNKKNGHRGYIMFFMVRPMEYLADKQVVEAALPPEATIHKKGGVKRKRSSETTDAV